MTNNATELESGRKWLLKFIIVPVVVAIIGGIATIIAAMIGLVPPGFVYEVICEQDYLGLNCVPIADFSVYPECGEPPLEVSLVNKSVGRIDRYIWDFGDGLDDVRETPRDHIYTEGGPYTIELIVSGPGGVDTTSIEIDVESCIAPTRTPTPISSDNNDTSPIIPTATNTIPTATNTIPPPGDTPVRSTPTVPSVYPDLVIGSITINPSTPTTSDLITFTVTVSNAGNALTNATILNVRVGGETFGQNYNIPSLVAGGQYTVIRQETLNVAQNYGITVIVDPDDMIIETNNVNNSAMQNFTVISGATTSPPDLVITSITASPANPTTTDVITITLTVRNNGGSTSGATTTTIRVGGETFGQSYSIPALSPGQTGVVSRQETLSVAQNYRTNVAVDPDNIVSEGNENNNTSYIDFTVSN